MHNQLLYIVYWVLTGLLLYTANYFFPQSVVLGNHKLNAFEAALYGSFWITFVSWAVVDIFHNRGLKQDNLLMFVAIYFVADTAAIWMIARIPRLAGFGIINYQWVLATAAILVVLQRIAWTFFGDKEKKKKSKKK